MKRLTTAAVFVTVNLRSAKDIDETLAALEPALAETKANTALTT